MMPLRMLGLFALMLLQCDVSSLCPDDILAVTSSEVIVEYGSTISLNCSKEDSNHYGIQWTYGNRNSVIEGDEAFVEMQLNLTDWNVRPQCILNLEEDVTCTKDLEITVYKNPDFVTVFPINHGIAMVEGTKHQLQCDITDVAPVQNLTVKWYKDDEIIHEEHFTNTTKAPMSESHILTLNISRKDNGALFRCEAQLDFGPDGPKPPALFDTHRVSVHYPPALNSKSPQVLYKEQGANVTLNCDAEGRPTPNFHWVHNGVDMTENTDSLFVNPVNNEDSVYNCTATNYLGRITKVFHVTTPPEVRAMPEDLSTIDCPLTLTPAELVVKLGDPASVNCSTSATNSARLGWEAQKGGTWSGDSTIITWTVEEVEFWNTSPFCYITTSDNDQCEVPLAMTVYNTPEIITEFPRGLVEEGEERLLQCDFINVAPVQNLTVKWYRGNESVKTETFDYASVQPVNVTSSLSVVHERHYNGQKFSCRAELQLGPNGPNPVPTVTSEPYTAAVTYKPQVKSCPNHFAGVEHNFILAMLPCEADGNPLPKVQWSHKGKLVNLSQPLTRSHSGRYEVEFSNDLGKTSTYVDITIDCPLTLTPAELVVKLGDPASVNCSTSATNSARLGWEAQKGGTWSGDSTIITWTVEKVEFWNASPICYITTSDNDQCEVSLAMTVYNTPEIITEFPRGLVEGEEHLLQCDFINVAPVQNLKVKWYRGNESVKTETFDYVSVQPVNVTSSLSVVSERRYNGQKFSCRAELHLGPNGPNPVPTVTSEPYTAAVTYKPQVKSCPNHFAGVEHNFILAMLPCEADGNPPPKVQWSHQGKPVNLSQPLTRSHSGRYKVEFSNDLGNTRTYVDITIQYGPSFTCDGRYEVKENDTFQTSCEPVGIPVPTITWFKDGKKVHQQFWTKHDSGKYTLEANNEHGTVRHEVEVDVMYAPELKYKDFHSQMLVPGANVTLNCSAEGKPAPEIRWNYTHAENVKEAKRGSNETVSITEATSVNVGVYICVATNKFGSVSTTVILRMKDDTSGLVWKASSWWWLLIALIILVVLISIILYFKRQKKHGQYSFVPDKIKEDIPMTKKSDGVTVA